jgi:hypothetical protein
MNLLAYYIGSAIIPTLISLICLAFIQPKTMIKVSLIILVVNILFIKITSVAAALISYFLSIAIFYATKKLISSIVNHKVVNNDK